MKTEITVSFTYGGWSLTYRKMLELPFIPFYGLGIDFSEKDFSVELKNDDYTHTSISYDIENVCFRVYIQNYWKLPVSDDTVDSVVDNFSDWEKMHNTNINDLKDIMLSHYKKTLP